MVIIKILSTVVHITQYIYNIYIVSIDRLYSIAVSTPQQLYNVRTPYAVIVSRSAGSDDCGAAIPYRSNQLTSATAMIHLRQPSSDLRLPVLLDSTALQRLLSFNYNLLQENVCKRFSPMQRASKWFYFMTPLSKMLGRLNAESHRN